MVECKIEGDNYVDIYYNSLHFNPWDTKH